MRSSLVFILGFALSARVNAQTENTQPPSAESVMEAVASVAGVLRASHDTPPAHAALPVPAGVHGACVSLWLDGERVGVGSSLRSGACLGEAAVRALAGLHERVPPAVDTLQEAARRERLGRVLVGVELAGKPEPVALGRFADAELTLQPGLDGVAVQRIVPGGGADGGGGEVVALFPSQLFLARDSAQAGLVSCVSMLTANPTLAMPGVKGHEASDVAGSVPCGYLRFRTVHAVQLTPGGQAVLLERFAARVPGATLTRETIRALADDVGSHLLARLVVVQGKRTAWATQFPPMAEREELCTSFQAALTAHALARWGMRGGSGAGEPHPGVTAARDLVIDLTDLDGARAGPRLTPRTAAMIAGALRSLRGSDAGGAQRVWARRAGEEAGASLRACLAPDAGFAGEIPEGDRGLVAFGLSALAQPGDTEACGLAERAVRATFRGSAVQTLVTHMPWLLEAELMLIEAGAEPGASRVVPSSALLRDVRAQTWAAQVTPARLGGYPWLDTPGDDLAGGFDLDALPRLSPTAQSARPLAFLAKMAGDGRLTAANERWREVSRVLAGVRFLRQISDDDACGFMHPQPAWVRGGVRAGPGDASQPIEASAMTLLALCETLDMLDRSAAQQAAEQAAQAGKSPPEDPR